MIMSPFASVFKACRSGRYNIIKQHEIPPEIFLCFFGNAANCQPKQ